MCGIYAVVNDNSAADTVLQGLKRLEYRGYDSWGVAVAGSSDIVVEKHVGKIDRERTTLPASTIGFGHTRWATHGGVTEANAHPHLDCTGKIALIHNGIIENYEELRQSLKRKHVFHSQTDTEVLVHLIEEYAERFPFQRAVQRAFLRAKGLNAIIAFDAESHQLVAAKTGSPLIFGANGRRTCIASDITSLAGLAHDIHILEDGEMIVISEEHVHLSTLRGKAKKLSMEPLTLKFERTQKGKYPHFMLKEMEEQPAVLANLANHAGTQLNTFAREMKTKLPVFIGCGSAYYMCLAGTSLFAALAHKKADYYQGNEFKYSQDLYGKEAFPLFVSQSGETIDIVEPAKTFRSRGVHIGAFVNVLGSTLERTVDLRMLLGAGPEICVASTKAVTAMLGAFVLLAGKVGKKERYAKEILGQAVKTMSQVLKKSYSRKYIRPLAEKLAHVHHIFMIGRGASYTTALEAALKMKEICYIHAEAFAGGELKHGMIALIEKGSPCIVFAPENAMYDEIISNAMEVKARGGYMIGVSSKKHPVFDAFLPVGDAKEATSIVQGVAAQMLAYETAVKLGKEIDKPRNLAKSVTVK